MTARVAAARYARALFDVVVKAGNPTQAESELADFAETLAAHETLARVLANPAVPVARKRAVLDALLARADRMTPALSKLLVLLAERDRLAILPEIVGAYRERVMQHQQVVRAEVTTAVPLPDDRRAAIERGLAAATGRRVILSARVDPSIIGGAVTRVGSTVYDGSVVRQLERLREQLTETA